MSDSTPTSPSVPALSRRAFVGAGAAGLAAATLPVATLPAAPLAAIPPAAAPPDGREYYELRTYELRNDLDPARSTAFFGEHLVPALRRAGATAVAAFTPESGLPQPSVVLLVAYPSLAAVGAAADALAGDAAYQQAAGAWEGGTPNGTSGVAPAAAPHGAPYVRYDVALYRAFAGHPTLEGAGGAAGRPGRLFELRTYEAPSAAGLRAKVAMFDQEEIRIFRASGFAPVFFGEAVAGARLPHLTYMIAFDDMAARGKAWGAFGSNPDWQRVRVRPGWTDPETVSSIRAAFVRPTAYSDVR